MRGALHPAQQRGETPSNYGDGQARPRRRRRTTVPSREPCRLRAAGPHLRRCRGFKVPRPPGRGQRKGPRRRFHRKEQQSSTHQNSHLKVFSRVSLDYGLLESRG